MQDKKVRFNAMEEAIGKVSDIARKNQNHLPEMMFDQFNCDLFDAVRPI